MELQEVLFSRPARKNSLRYVLYSAPDVGLICHPEYSTDCLVCICIWYHMCTSMSGKYPQIDVSAIAVPVHRSRLARYNEQ